MLTAWGVRGASALLVVPSVLEIREWLWERGQGEEPGKPRSVPKGTWGLVLLGLSVSLDEMGAGFAVGTAGAPLAVFGPALAVQAVLFSYLGMRAGGA